MRITFFVTAALLAVSQAASLPGSCSDQSYVEISAEVGDDVNLCTLSGQLQGAQKEKEDTAEAELKKAQEMLDKAKKAQEDADKAKTDADTAQAKADSLAGSTAKAREAISDAQAKKD